MASATYVTIASIDVPVFENTPYEEPPDLVGVWEPVGDNSVMSSERTPKRKFAFVGKFIPADFDTFLAAISVSGQPGVPTPVAVTSPADGLTRGATISAWVRCGRAQSLSRGAGDFKTNIWSVPITVREA